MKSWSNEVENDMAEPKKKEEEKWSQCRDYISTTFFFSFFLAHTGFDSAFFPF